MPERFKKKKMNLRRRDFINATLSCLLRISVKVLVACGYTALFGKLGLTIGIWEKILVWVTSFWISNQLVQWLICKAFALMFADDLELVSEYEGLAKYASELRDLFNNLKQLIFYTTDK